MAKCTSINPQFNRQCARESVGESGVCCSSCSSGSHTVECNLKTFPGQPAAPYYDNPNREIELLQRLQRAIALAETLQDEFNELRNISNGLSLRWGPPLESLLAHLSIDLQYTAGEVKRLIGR